MSKYVTLEVEVADDMSSIIVASAVINLAIVEDARIIKVRKEPDESYLNDV